MPTYDYSCKRCGEMEVFQSIRENPLTKCPTCKSPSFQRMISRGAGVIFKGSGFWETDYNRGADYTKKAAADKKPGTNDKTPAQTDAPVPAAKPQLKAEPKPESPSTAATETKKPSRSSTKPTDGTTKP